jgi:hypothetical protein
MGHEPREDLDALRGIAAQLNATTTEASIVVQAVDHFLGEELCIGVSAASRPFDSQRVLGDDDRELVVTSHLAFGRVQGKDRIYVLKATLEKNEWKENFTKIVAEDRTPWTACSREVKLQSFALLPELLGNLAVRVDEVSNQTTRTIETVRALIDVMKQSPAGERERELEHDPGVVDDDKPVDVPLHELTVSASPNLFKRPRSKP